MKALGLIEVYSFTTAVCVADIMAKAADIKVIAFDRNRPIRPDVPAPLVMEVKIEGVVGAVNAAIEAGVNYAKEKGKYIVSHVIPAPDTQTDKMAYLLDINRDKYNKKLPKNLIDYPEEKVKDIDGAFGILEIEGLVAAIEGLDAMVKASSVNIVHTEKRLGGRLVTLIVKGNVSATKAAVEAGQTAALKIGKIFGAEVIARPSRELSKFFDIE
ncbi:MAG: BMC domain-containing protein [Clostridia bacterium]|nr:BMC domain-containing protein [Clostridia bacterium]